MTTRAEALLARLGHTFRGCKIVRARRDGQSMVEFAFVLPIFLTVLFGTIELGWAVYAYNTVSHMANEGARRGMVLNRPATNYGSSYPGNQDTNNSYDGTGGSSSVGSTYVNLSPSDADRSCPATPSAATIEIMQAIACQVGALPLDQISVLLDTPTTTAFPTGNVPSGNPITVKVRYNYRPLIGYPLNLPPFTMTSTAVTQTQ